jgi:hypothetical protein
LRDAFGFIPQPVISSSIELNLRRPAADRQVNLHRPRPAQALPQCVLRRNMLLQHGNPSTFMLLRTID